MHFNDQSLLLLSNQEKLISTPSALRCQVECLPTNMDFHGKGDSIVGGEIIAGLLGVCVNFGCDNTLNGQEDSGGEHALGV